MLVVLRSSNLSHLADPGMSGEFSVSEGDGRVLARDAVQTAAALAGYKSSLGQPISHLVSTKGLRNHLSRLVGVPFLDL